MTLSDTAATTFTYFAAAGGGEGFILLATDSHLFFLNYRFRADELFIGFS